MNFTNFVDQGQSSHFTEENITPTPNFNDVHECFVTAIERTQLVGR